MANLRIVSVTVVNSTNITATFSANLNEDIGISNITVISQTPGVPNPSILGVSIVTNTITVTTQPLIPLAAYFITFLSTTTQLFNSLNGDAVILNDGVTNRQLIIGPIETNNPIQTYLINFFQNNVYNLESSSMVSNYIQGLATILSDTLYDIRQAGNENYLSFLVTDELQTRGPGPFDRLDEESAYEVLRVGLNPTGYNLSNVTRVASFPNYLISLQSTNNTETLSVGSNNNAGTFNINTFTLNMSEQFVIILNSVVFIYGSNSYTYNVQEYGYQILDSQYDPNYAFTYLQLANNQIILNENVLNDPNFSLKNLVGVQVNYQYKDTGRVVDSTSLVIDADLPSGREVTPPIENIFALQHAPIVTSADVIGSIGDVLFINPNAIPGSGTPHPAFLYEIPFRLDYLPSVPGEYSVDYTTGNVYVFGASTTGDGTGPYPPLAVYTYRYTFMSEVDYVYNVDSLDLTGLPNGSLIGSPANILYNYEEVLTQGIDYQADVHIEQLSEPIQNRLVALNAIQPLNFPVTDVFRIFNQTTGEIYSPLRWTDNQIYFTYINAPNIENQVGEIVSFQYVLNSLLFVSAVTSSGPNNIYQMFLSDNNIISATQDCIGSSINTSAYFSNTNIFVQEIYFDNSLTTAQNNARLLNIGDYQIDYINGIVWCLVPPTQDFSIGTISYKRGYINPQNPHVITVNNIYYRPSLLTQITKTFGYINFSNGSILPSSFDVSNEEFFMGNTTYPYTLLGGQVGEFINATFTPGVTSYVNFVRGLFEYNDLLNNKQPINFVNSTTSNGMSVSVAPLQFSEYHTVQHNNIDGYYVLANTDLLYQSPNIAMNFSVVRLSDQAQLYSSGNIVLGTPFKLILTNNFPNIGDAVLLTYSYTINDFSIDPSTRVVVDYNKGYYFVDYSYLADDIIISYEYGDNVLDFSQSNALDLGEQYYVTYRVGALRDALLANFGTLINIPILNTLDVSFARENYRDALMGAMQSFTTGPTVKSMSNLVNTIVHTPPKIIESAFSNWSLGSSLLNPEPITTKGTFALTPAKYGNGVTVDTSGQLIKFPVSSNLRLEQGSFGAWVKPEWNGIDNESTLIINILKNGIPVPAQDIFIGPAGYHPTFLDGYTVSLSTKDKVLGVPNENKNGVFIYYTADSSGQFNRWYIDVIDGYSDGYMDGYYTKNYRISMNTDGRFYDVKSTTFPSPHGGLIFSGTNTVTYTITGQTEVSQGITFVADSQHYIFDFGKSEGQNRFSIFKDETGYINFRVIDKHKNTYIVSADVSSWVAGELHYVAASWAINTKNFQDEMHLFIDGFEVPNIIVYKNKVSPYLHEKFRTVNPEEVVGMIPSAIVGSTDLVTTYNSQSVSSSVDFSAYNVLPGAIIYIEEPGFNPAGYTVLNVNGQTLTLATPMPLSSTGSSYSVNATTFPVKTEIDLYPNIAVSLMRTLPITFLHDLETVEGENVVMSPSTNFNTLGILPGYIISISEQEFDATNTILAVNGNSLVLDDYSPATLSGLTFYIYSGAEQEIPGVRALHPAYEISRVTADGYDTVELTITNSAQPNDIVLIRTLGLNSKYIDKKFYLWNGPVEPVVTVNTLMTRLPSPILLSDVKITHILLDNYLVSPTGSTLIYTDQPSLSDNGRTLAVKVAASNVNYSIPVVVTINGIVGGSPFSDELTFTANGIEHTTVQFESVTSVSVTCEPINPLLNSLVLSIEELYPITEPENSLTFPIIRYSYQMQVGNTLSGYDGYVTDPNGFFSSEAIGNYLVISSPSNAAGQYQILAVSEDHVSATISGSVPIFSGGIYQVLNTTTYRSGLQNGFFTFELADGYMGDGYVGLPYNLVQGLYKLEYYSYTSIPLEVGTLYGFVGSDINGNNLFDGTLDELQIVSEMLTDTRIGETASANQETITKDYNSLKALQPSVTTLMLLHFDTFPFSNVASVYTTADKYFIQSAATVNSNFDTAICVTDRPVIIDNTGILHPKAQGTIEFWVSPLYDTGNDPNYRYYFDASAIVSQQVLSTNNATVTVSGRVAQVLSVKVQTGNQNVDYFAGGKIDPNKQTLYLNRALPNQQTPLIVNYIPIGTQGDRISIYKDPAGYINFKVRASGIDYQVRSPAYWPKNTWHRLKAQYIVNTGLGSDQIKFFVDGYERGDILFGGPQNLLFGQGQVLGSSYLNQNNIQASIVFKDTVNELFIGSDYTGSNTAYALIDNLRISDISRPLFMPYGESIDVNYSSNLSIVYPVTTDLYTTLLLDFNSLVTLQTDFVTLKNKKIGLFDFTINIYDQFGILTNSATTKQVLEELINTLKPANSRVFINYLA